MKRLSTILLALALAGCAATPPPSSQARGPSEGTVLRRATLVTHDIEKSIAFYSMIGFEPWFLGPPGKITETGLPVEGTKVGDPSRFVIMRGKHPHIGMVGLLQYGEATQPAEPALRHGDAIMMIEAEGLDRIYAELVAAGYKVIKPIKTSHIKTAEAEWDSRVAMVFDPDGHMVELVERLN